MIIDSQALVLAIGKPKNAFTFGNLGKPFLNLVRRIGSKFSRADIVFDRYRQHSVKNYTRQKRSATCIPIRRVIDNPGVPLSWHCQSTKLTLHFLCPIALLKSHSHTLKSLSGGFLDEKVILSTCAETNISSLQASHK